MSLVPQREIFRVPEVLDFLSDDLEGMQSFRAVCRSAASEYAIDTMCWCAFHEKDIGFDPRSDPALPLWMRCTRYNVIALPDAERNG